MTIAHPTMLSFERKLETSDALMFSGRWQAQADNKDWHPIKIIPRFNRATQSAHGISDEQKTKPNPVENSDDANLPLDHDTLLVSFSLRVIGNLGQPFACNSPEFEQAISEKVAQFKQEKMFDELARRYASNIANGRFLWRNRVGAEEINIVVTINNQAPFSFSAYDYSLNNFKQTDNKITTLANAIKDGLQNDNFVLIKVHAFVKLGAGQHVFPSQKMNMGEKRKALFKIDDQAAMHNVKIGNALRTIDDWYKNGNAQQSTPIAVEPFGAVTQRGQAHRESRNDLYTLMMTWVNDNDISDEEQAYVVANLIRGGVFSAQSDNDKKENKASKSGAKGRNK